MGKTRTKDAPRTSMPRLKPAKKPSAPSAVAFTVQNEYVPETEIVTISTQTCFAEAGSCEDVKEKATDLKSAVEKAMRKRQRDRKEGRRGVTAQGRTGGCLVCFERYDSQRLPICLPCGHSICKSCTSNTASSPIITCPFDHQSFDIRASPLPTNFLLYHLHEGLPSGPVCEVHNSEVLGYCVSDSTLLCAVCLFVHKEHEPIPLSSPLASHICFAKQSTLSTQSQLLQGHITRWEAWVYTLETLCLSLNLTPLAINMNFMLCNEIPVVPGTDEHCLAAACEELNKLRALNHDFLEVIREAAWELDQFAQRYATLPLSEQLRIAVPSEVRVPESQEVLTSLSLLVNRLSYYSGQMWGGNQGF